MAIDDSDREVLQTCIQWLEQDHKVDLVTVARTWGSSPRPPGSMAAIRDDGVLVGSVSGGCVEKQIAESFGSSDKNAIHTHLVDDDQARRYGLACGGQLMLVFESVKDTAQFKEILTALDERKRVCRIIEIGGQTASIMDANAKDAFSYDGKELKKVFGPSWRIVLIGAGQLSRFVAEFCQPLDFSVTVCDPRKEFIEGWNVAGSTVLDLEPHEAVMQHANDVHTAVLALTHDPNLDDMALIEALPSACFYVGALGSKRNYERRCKRLSAILEDADIARLHGPVGIDIGSRTSAEIALSIMAEVVKERALLLQTR